MTYYILQTMAKAPASSEQKHMMEINVVGSTPPYKLLLYAPIDSLAEPAMIILKNIPLISYKFSIMLTCKK